MRTIAPISTYAIPSFADGAYPYDLAHAISAAAVLASVLLLAWLFVFATFKIVRVFIDALRMSAVVADFITVAVLTIAVIIGVLNR